MQYLTHRSRFFALIVGAITVFPVGGQTDSIPKISARSFVSGNATLVVRGAVQIEQEIALNTAASFGSGDMTWLQFGDSGSAEPNVGVTFSTYEVGVSVGRGKFIATGGLIPGEQNTCSGKTEVTASSVAGEYKCIGVVSHDPGGSGTGKVDIDIRFTANS